MVAGSGGAFVNDGMSSRKRISERATEFTVVNTEAEVPGALQAPSGDRDFGAGGCAMTDAQVYLAPDEERCVQGGDAGNPSVRYLVYRKTALEDHLHHTGSRFEDMSL